MTDYEKFKAIADDIAEMYADGYADYAEYFSEAFSEFGEMSAVSRLSDRVYSLKGADIKSDRFTKTMKEIVIDAILSIGEAARFLDVGARYWCYNAIVGTRNFIHGRIYKYIGDATFVDQTSGAKVVAIAEVPVQRYLQKIIEKK